MNDWKERMQRENNKEARKRQQSSFPKKNIEEISGEAGQILKKINAFNLLNKTREEIWGGEGEILSSKVDYRHRYKDGEKMEFIPKNPWNAFFDTTCIAGLRLQTKFLSISYRETDVSGGHASDYSIRSGGGYVYSTIRKEDHYSTTSIHVFHQKTQKGIDGEESIYIVRIWDGEFTVNANEVVGETLPGFLPYRASPMYVATLTESFNPAGKGAPFNTAALNELLYATAKKRIRGNRLPSQLASKTISEIKQRSSSSEVKIIT